jgi:hypothetical protein
MKIVRLHAVQIEEETQLASYLTDERAEKRQADSTVSSGSDLRNCIPRVVFWLLTEMTGSTESRDPREMKGIQAEERTRPDISVTFGEIEVHCMIYRLPAKGLKAESDLVRFYEVGGLRKD